MMVVVGEGCKVDNNSYPIEKDKFFVLSNSKIYP
jgi:hypothetical protein